MCVCVCVCVMTDDDNDDNGGWICHSRNEWRKMQTSTLKFHDSLYPLRSASTHFTARDMRCGVGLGTGEPGEGKMYDSACFSTNNTHGCCQI